MPPAPFQKAGRLKNSPALASDLIERIIPEKPNSRLQRYRLTAKGRALLKTLHQTS